MSTKEHLGLSQILHHQYGRLKSSVKAKFLPILYKLLPFGYRYIYSSLADLKLWQISYNKRLSQVYCDPKTMSGVHLVENVSVVLLWFSAPTDFAPPA